ncbi:CDP-alcohol phosphatidyltransferase family protein [Sphaerisporangium rubeum]|uniref:Phosphatidylglycerophosphate synthase n=1 Tax=Sphaerisporangium rubeum TaxID=321317 RepID=A0A7X0IIM9_9ACTN|nr:CDP-alcohol phosphatidyltransferase family protein [Sphaerisporangium rubeum]MBB6475645.1 phosphatidylglycerophosphate synthase [Sphaerisporangium rubeum]
MATLDWRDTSITFKEPAIGLATQVVLLGALYIAVGLGPAAWVAGTTYAVILSAILTYALLRSRTRTLGPAGLVTLARAELVGAVTALVTMSYLGNPTPAALLVTLATVALILDAVDGHVARRTGTASPLGARFDMEVDAFLILVLSIHLAATAGPWVLAIGLMRYAFVAASWTAPWLKSPLPPSMARKTVAALQGILLVTAASEVLPATTLLLATALATLTWSFTRDILWLYRNRPATP